MRIADYSSTLMHHIHFTLLLAGDAHKHKSLSEHFNRFLCSCNIRRVCALLWQIAAFIKLLNNQQGGKGETLPDLWV